VGHAGMCQRIPASHAAATSTVGHASLAALKVLAAAPLLLLPAVVVAAGELARVWAAMGY
jgi:hypothetical protein